MQDPVAATPRSRDEVSDLLTRARRRLSCETAEVDGQRSLVSGDGLGLQVIDGGDRACGELLLVLAAQARRLAPGSRIRLLASDPAAPLDLPAWCHLTGHYYRGRGSDASGRVYYDIEMAAQAVPTDQIHPWRLDSEAAGTHQ